MRISALARHPLAIAGAVITTASAVVFVALVIAMLAGMLDQPVRGAGRLHRDPRRVRARTAAHPGGHVARAAQAAAPSRRRRRVAGHRFPPRGHVATGRCSSSRRSPPSTSSSCCWRDTAACTAMEYASVLRTDVPHADASAVHGVAGRGRTPAVAVRRMPHRRGRGGVRAREAGRRAAAGAGRDQFLSRARFRPAPTCRPALRRRCARGCHRPGRVLGDQHPRHSRIRRRRGEHRDDHRAADAHERSRPTSATARSTGTPNRTVRVEYVATDAERQTIPFVHVTDAKGQVKEFVGRGRNPGR